MTSKCLIIVNKFYLFLCVGLVFFCHSLVQAEDDYSNSTRAITSQDKVGFTGYPVGSQDASDKLATILFNSPMKDGFILLYNKNPVYMEGMFRESYAYMQTSLKTSYSESTHLIFMATALEQYMADPKPDKSSDLLGNDKFTIEKMPNIDELIAEFQEIKRDEIRNLDISQYFKQDQKP